MADITVTAAQVAPVNEFEYESWTLKKASATAITVGQAIAIDSTTGLAVLADASSGAANKCRGICIEVASDTTIVVMVHGSLAGFTLTGADYDDQIFLSNTAGALDDATGGDVSVAVGRVKPMHDAATAPTKVLYVNIPAIM